MKGVDAKGTSADMDGTTTWHAAEEGGAAAAAAADC